MTTKPRKSAKPLSLREAFEIEHARRELERRSKEEAERKQQEADLAGATALHELISADAEFLEEHALTADQRRYTVALDHAKFRIAAYFEAGVVNVTLSDKRAAIPGASAPRRQETAESVEDALRLMAQFLADETR